MRNEVINEFELCVFGIITNYLTRKIKRDDVLVDDIRCAALV